MVTFWIYKHQRGLNFSHKTSNILKTSKFHRFNVVHIILVFLTHLVNCTYGELVRLVSSAILKIKTCVFPSTLSRDSCQMVMNSLRKWLLAISIPWFLQTQAEFFSLVLMDQTQHTIQSILSHKLDCPQFPFKSNPKKLRLFSHNKVNFITGQTWTLCSKCLNLMLRQLMTTNYAKMWLLLDANTSSTSSI